MHNRVTAALTMELYVKQTRFREMRRAYGIFICDCWKSRRVEWPLKSRQCLRVGPIDVVFFFLRLIGEFYLYDTLQVVQPVACCSVQHHQVSVTTVQWTFAGDVLCGLVCSATLTRCWWRQSHPVHVRFKPAIASSNTVQAHQGLPG